MLYPSLASLLDQVPSRYLLVNIIARRARELSIEATDSGEGSNEKAVSQAIGEIAAGQLRTNIHEEL
jgi:DNA-directed RNA polymerase subunit omega